MPFTAPDQPRPVRAKMYVTELAYTQWGTTVKLRAVSRGDDNKEWAAATPNGELSLTIKNQGAADQFAPDQEWFVDLIPVPAEHVGAEGMATPVPETA